ncbi:hypothetical protein [Candidatus Vidania fulgoroideorum]
MKKKINEILNKILIKKFKFNESIDLNYNFFLKNNLNFKNYLILPHKTKNKRIFSFVKNENYIISKSIVGERNTFCNKKKIKKNKYYFFDLDSYYSLKKEINELIRKKIRISIEYGNVSNDFNFLKLMNEGRLISFNFKNNFSFNVGNVYMCKKKILKNILYANKFIFEFLYSKGLCKKNFLSLYIKSTQGFSYKI